MKALASVSGCACILRDERDGVAVVDVCNGAVVAGAQAHITYGGCQDWRVIEATDQHNLFTDIQNAHALLQAQTFIESCLRGLSSQLTVSLLQLCEEYSQQYGTEALRNRLLQAPLEAPEAIAPLVTLSLSNGLNAIGHTLECVEDLQVLLKRLTSHWLHLADSLFIAFHANRQEVWGLAVDQGIVYASLESQSSRDFQARWGQLVFSFPNPAQRSAIASIQAALTSRLFPADHSDGDTSASTSHLISQDAEQERQSALDGAEAQAQYSRVRKQIEAISDAMGRGEDDKAMRFLRQLIDEQVEYERGEEFAVKSLCNIAQQCAQMFRTDFEYECLTAAVKLAPNDGWAWVQLANHYKRARRFGDALEALDRADSLGESEIAVSARADVFAEQGDYENAMRIYSSIPSDQQSAAVRGARADLLRRSGELEQAEQEYARLEQEGKSSHRTDAGRAEIAKRRGQLQRAYRAYTAILELPELEDTARYVYKLALANVLMRMSRYSDALRHVDDTVREWPFAREARIRRAALMGLLGDAEDAIRELPVVGQAGAFREWISDFVRGGLLLLLDRYGDAQVSLLEQLETRFAFADKEGKDILRLGAAVFLLRNITGVPKADLVLGQLGHESDVFTKWVRSALAYHVAVVMRKKETIAQLEDELSSVADEGISNVVAAIQRKDWNEVRRLEAQLVLRLAS